MKKKFKRAITRLIFGETGTPRGTQASIPADHTPNRIKLPEESPPNRPPSKVSRTIKRRVNNPTYNRVINPIMDEFEDWMTDVKQLSNATIDHYTQAVSKIITDLLISGHLNLKALQDQNFSVTELENLKDYYFGIPQNSASNNKGHQMYSAGFNNFISFTLSKSSGEESIKRNPQSVAINRTLRPKHVNTNPKIPVTRKPKVKPKIVHTEDTSRSTSEPKGYTHQHLEVLRWFDKRSGENHDFPPTPMKDGTLLVNKYGGIYKPKWSDYAISITNHLPGKYDSITFEHDGSWVYKYYKEHTYTTRGRLEYRSRALLKCCEDQVPIGIFLLENKDLRLYKILGLAKIEKWEDGYFLMRPISLYEVPDLSTKSSTPKLSSESKPKNSKTRKTALRKTRRAKKNSDRKDSEPPTLLNPSSIRKVIVRLNPEMSPIADMMEYQHQQDESLNLTVNKNHASYRTLQSQESKEVYVKYALVLDALTEISQRASSATISATTASRLRNQFAQHLEKYEYEYHGSWD